MKKILLDTDILSFIMRKKDKNVMYNYEAYLEKEPSLNISRVTVLEILNGLKHRDAHAQLERFRVFISEHNILELDEIAVEIASDLYAKHSKQGRMRGHNDLLIAAIAISNNMVLCTNNTKDYENIEELELINWVLKIY